jgi:predicted metalloendopeptidase
MSDFYASYMDQQRRNELGLAPLKGLAARFERIGAGSPFNMNVRQDNRDSTRYIVGKPAP